MIRSVLAPALALVLAASPAAAQRPPASGETMAVHPEAQSAIDRIKSPYCPGLMLEVCTSSGGAMLRDSAQSWALQGLSSDSIVERVIAEYGEEYRAEPRSSGTGLWAWILPPGVLVVGLGGVGLVLARRRRGEPLPATEGEPVGPEDEARLRAAIREMEEEEEPVF
ncbi:MAG TPA: cytochrome c-type biogenesis protein CcmH [Longimicrobiales bacterium]|nr:cytochrome c-type biogenesis protein CcmH [Longimicrobiales bacterium]